MHELIPWRTITGRQQFYQDHLWMQAFGEQMISTARPSNQPAPLVAQGQKTNGNKELVLNFLTPHQKWGFTAPTPTTC